MKDLRVKLKPSDAADFQAAKYKAERELGFSMSDSEFAGRVVRQAVKRSGSTNQRVELEGDIKITQEQEQEFLKQLKRQG